MKKKKKDGQDKNKKREKDVTALSLSRFAQTEDRMEREGK